MSPAGVDPVALKDAVSALVEGDRHSVEEAVSAVPPAAGLYAVHGDQNASRDLAISDIHDRPLYVGKAERSLVGRDVGTHFSTGKTGSSTLRRSIGALLADALGLRAVPRSAGVGQGTANFSFDVAGDQKLTDWMRAHLVLSVWVNRDGISLDEIEGQVIKQLLPPLNLAKMGKFADPRVRAARAAMAAEARKSEEVRRAQ